MNTILEDIIKERKGMYCHALEAYTLEEMKETLGELFFEFSNRYPLEEIRDFLKTISIYHLEDDSLSEEENEIRENEIYNFNFHTFISNLEI